MPFPDQVIRAMARFIAFDRYGTQLPRREIMGSLLKHFLFFGQFKCNHSISSR